MISRININIADIRAEPKFQSERTSQALFNERVEILDEKDGYLRVKSRDGYIGWIAAQFTSEYREYRSEKTYLVTSNLTPGFTYPDTDSARIVYLPYGCSLYGEEKDGFLRILSERYGEIYVRLGETLTLTSPLEPFRPNRDFIKSEAEKFLSAPYLWGGRSFFGIDCSGFIQTIMRRFGWDLPRDTKDQINCGVEIDRKSVRNGDLLFFPRHVALAVSKREFIHSSSSNGGVASNSFDRKSPVYSEYLDKNFIAARRVIFAGGG
ncbi:MAG: C40 family peptidase [Candidatus Zixiibacteriota bacterium]|nr:MAG: C40 family peptidase [candidate division Zixibacteria bacterium]